MALIAIDKSGVMVSAVTERGEFWTLATSFGRPIWADDFKVINKDGEKETVLFGGNYDDEEGKDFSSSELYDLMWLHQITELKEGTYPLRHPLMVHSNMSPQYWAGITDKGTIVRLSVDNKNFVVQLDSPEDEHFGLLIDGKNEASIATAIMGVEETTQSLQWGLLAEHRPETPKFAMVFSSIRDVNCLINVNPTPEVLEGWVDSLDKELEKLL